MTQVATIVRDALSHLRVIDRAAALTAIDAVAMQDGIHALNLMMRRWEADGVALGWTDVSDPTETLPLPAEAEEAVGYNLAVRLRARFGVSISPDVVQLATDGLARLVADVQANTYVRVCYDDLPMGTGQRDGDGWREGYYR